MLLQKRQDVMTENDQGFENKHMNAHSFYIMIDSKELGPFTESQIVVWIADGVLKTDTPMLGPNSQNWQTAGILFAERFLPAEQPEKKRNDDQNPRNEASDKGILYWTAVFIVAHVPVCIVLVFYFSVYLPWQLNTPEREIHSFISLFLWVIGSIIAIGTTIVFLGLLGTIKVFTKVSSKNRNREGD